MTAPTDPPPGLFAASVPKALLLLTEARGDSSSAHGGDVVASLRPSPMCGATTEGRKTTACSNKCRALKRRRARVPLPVAEAREIRASLTTILETAWEIQATLERYGTGEERNRPIRW